MKHVSITSDFENDRSRPATWSGRKRGQQFQAIGRSRGGITTKIHAIVDGLGNPLRNELTGGHHHDCVTGHEMLQTMGLQGMNVIADREYDMNNILNLLVECLFNKLKHYRRLATQYDKLACTFGAFLTLASILLWLN
ncbi:transposase [Paenibacillus maysiensis]|uniref:transposase n=1 Tax=Paenibacillus maysiensis TaxID=1155954 RepID=UPI0004AEDB27|nr:transposase [Paenibacillus maysiensis]